jgi:branched-chain amino acid transport system substrate-binding protein
MKPAGRFKGWAVRSGLVAIAVIVLLVSLRFILTPVQIGMILPIDTSLGNEINLFARYYQDKATRIGLRPLKIIIENPPATQEAVRAAYKRLDDLGVSLIVGGVLSRDGTWLAEAAAESGIPTFGVTASSAALSGRKDGFFRLSPSNDAQARAVAQSYNNKSSQRLLLVTSSTNTAYVDPYVSMLVAHYKGAVLQVPFSTAEALAQQIEGFRPDGLFSILPAKDLIQVINLARERGDKYLIGSASWGSTEILSLYSGPALDGVKFFMLGLGDLQGSFKTEISEFEKKYSMTATNGSLYLVSILHIIRQAVEAAGPSRAALKSWLETPRTYETAYGLLALDEFGDSITDRTIVMQTVDGQLRSVDFIKDQP